MSHPGRIERKEGPKGSAEKQKDALKVAETMDKFSLMMGKLDDKIKIYEGKVAKHSKWKNYSKKYQNNIKKRLRWEKGKLLKYKILKKRMEKTSEKLNKIEAEKNGAYSKVAMETLNKINITMDKQAKIWGFDLRQDMVKNLHKAAFKELGKNRINLDSVKNIFVMMKNGEQARYKGYKISKKGNKITLAYKGVTREFTLSVKGKNLEWEIRDEKGKKIRGKKSKALFTEGLFNDDSGEKSLSDQSNFYYYKSKSAVSAYSKYKVKEKIAKAAPNPAETKRKVLKKITTFKTKPKPKPAVKPAPRKVVAKAPSKPIPTKLKQAAKQSEEAIKRTPESKETIAALNNWGNSIATKIGHLTRNIYSKITMAKQFMRASTAKNKMNHLTRYKQALEGVAKKLKSSKGISKVNAVNKLAAVYKLLPKNLSTNWADKYKIYVAAPPQTIAKLTVHPDILNKGAKPGKRPAVKPKTAVASKGEYSEPKPKAPQKVVAKPKAKIAAKETKEKTPGLKKWASQNDKMLRDIRREFILRNDRALHKMYSNHTSEVLTRLNTLNRDLKNPKITFVKAVQICKNLRTGFRDLQKKAKEKKIHYVGKNVKKHISDMTILEFPPAPKNPTVAEQKLIKTENKRMAGIKEFTNITA
jgi:hypothetical protein